MRIRALLVAVACLAVPIAAAQPSPPANPNAQASALAERLGRDRNAEGLQLILESRNADLLAAYRRGISMRAGAMPPMRPEIESLVLRFLDEPAVARGLRELAGLERTQSRALFDKLLADWKAHPGAYDLRNAVLRTDAPGAEADLLAWLASATPPARDDFRGIVHFLAEKRYAPAIPVLASWPAEDPDDASAVLHALVDLGTLEAIRAAFPRLARLKEDSTPRAAEIRRSVLQKLSPPKEGVALGYAEFRAAEPEAAKASAPAWLEKRKDRAALDDTVASLASPQVGGNSVLVLLATDDPLVWKRARDEVERLHASGALDEPRYRFAVIELDRKLADPRAHFAQREQERRYKAYEEGARPILQARAAAVASMADDPAKTYEVLRQLALRQEALARESGLDARTLYGGIPGQISQAFMQVGDIARFRLKRPADAIAAFEGAARWGFAGGGMAVADTQQWDLRDTAAALATWRGVAAELRSPLGRAAAQGEDVLRSAMAHWAEAQAAWLGEHKTFRGTVGEDDVALAALLVLYRGAMVESSIDIPRLPPQGDAATLARDLAAIQASGTAFVLTVLATQYLPSARAIRTYFDRMDPAGFGAATFCVLVQHLDPVKEPEGARVLPALVRDPSPRHPLRVAAREFLRERGIVDRVPDRPLR